MIFLWEQYIFFFVYLYNIVEPHLTTTSLIRPISFDVFSPFYLSRIILHSLFSKVFFDMLRITIPKRIPYLRTEHLKNHTLLGGTYLYSLKYGSTPGLSPQTALPVTVIVFPLKGCNFSVLCLKRVSIFDFLPLNRFKNFRGTSIPNWREYHPSPLTLGEAVTIRRG